MGTARAVTEACLLPFATRLVVPHLVGRPFQLLAAVDVLADVCVVMPD